jgi:signal transduction histidine kinase
MLVVFGTTFAIAYASFKYTVLPMFEGLLEAKSMRIARLAAEQLDVPLGADDSPLIATTVASIMRDPDFASVVVRDGHDHVVWMQGAPPDRELFSGAPFSPFNHASHISSWAPVSLEGMKLGSVGVVLTTTRLDTLDRWAQRLAMLIVVLWLCAFGYSIAFARSFVSPIFAMMEFSRKVAGGALTERLTTRASGELAELREYLNRMASELERLEQERMLEQARSETMQRELLAVSRMAGMAEIATGVIHNVGNVLNSLNVSVTVVGDQLRKSRVNALGRSIGQLDAFPGGLSAFLVTDKGKALPEYLSAVSKHLAVENGRMLGELESIKSNVDHIKAIVATQQSYSLATGVVEEVRVEELVEDALRMGQSSFTKHGVEVRRDFGMNVCAITDRHKLLQILINLVSNARHALHDAAERVLTVQLVSTHDTVTISITDTGVGIPAENLDRIFIHGFTTKSGGHGFGLHSSANAARELGGTLAVTSEGAGHGATFTLTLPTTPTKASHVIN